MATEKLTFTHPRTGQKVSRTTDTEKHDYQFISFKRGENPKWHETREAAERRGGDVFPIPGREAQGPSELGANDLAPAEGATCTVGPSATSGQRCGKPAVTSFIGSNGQVLSECAEHAVGRASRC